MLRAAVMLGRRLLSCAPAPHALRLNHGFAHSGIARERGRFVEGVIATRALTGKRLAKGVRRSATDKHALAATRPLGELLTRRRNRNKFCQFPLSGIGETTGTSETSACPDSPICPGGPDSLAQAHCAPPSFLVIFTIGVSCRTTAPPVQMKTRNRGFAIRTPLRSPVSHSRGRKYARMNTRQAQGRPPLSEPSTLRRVFVLSWPLQCAGEEWTKRCVTFRARGVCHTHSAISSTQ